MGKKISKMETMVEIQNSSVRVGLFLIVNIRYFNVYDLAD
jgi:hypothetical protein